MKEGCRVLPECEQHPSARHCLLAIHPSYRTGWGSLDEGGVLCVDAMTADMDGWLAEVECRAVRSNPSASIRGRLLTSFDLFDPFDSFE